MIHVDMSELKKWRLTLGNADVDATVKDTLKEAVAMALRGTKLKTPVKAGTLRRGWKITGITREGNGWVVTLYNDVKYAMYVEYGHRTRLNRTTGLRKGFVPGRYMMKLSCDEVQRNMPALVKKHMDKLYQKMGYR